MRLFYGLEPRTNRRLILNVYHGSAFHSSCNQNAPNTRRPGDEQYVFLPISLISHIFRSIISSSIMPIAPSGHNKLRRSTQYTSHQTIGSMHWLFRTNIPRRRSSYYPPDVRKRNFFGIGEIVGVLANVRSNRCFRLIF